MLQTLLSSQRLWPRHPVIFWITLSEYINTPPTRTHTQNLARIKHNSYCLQNMLFMLYFLAQFEDSTIYLLSDISGESFCFPFLHHLPVTSIPPARCLGSSYQQLSHIALPPIVTILVLTLTKPCLNCRNSLLTGVPASSFNSTNSLLQSYMKI